MSPDLNLLKNRDNLFSLLLFVIVILWFHLRFWYRARLLWKLDKGGQNGTERRATSLKTLLAGQLTAPPPPASYRNRRRGFSTIMLQFHRYAATQVKCCRETFPCSCYVRNEGDNLMSAKSATEYHVMSDFRGFGRLLNMRKVREM